MSIEHRVLEGAGQGQPGPNRSTAQATISPAGAVFERGRMLGQLGAEFGRPGFTGHNTHSPETLSPMHGRTPHTPSDDRSCPAPVSTLGANPVRPTCIPSGLDSVVRLAGRASRAAEPLPGPGAGRSLRPALGLGSRLYMTIQIIF